LYKFADEIILPRDKHGKDGCPLRETREVLNDIACCAVCRVP
jgi:hypothetical protein